MEIRNAIIGGAHITVEDHGILTAGLILDSCDGVQVFECGVYAPKSGINGKNYAGHFIYRVLEIVGVHRWSQLEGKAVRVMGDSTHIEAIGHIIKDVWFEPGKEFGQPNQEVSA
jgi:hypothetical protein